MLKIVCIVCLALLVPGFAALALPSPRVAAQASSEDYPTRRESTRVLYYSVASAAPRTAIEKALAALVTTESRAKLVDGPHVSPARPKHAFVMLEVPLAIQAEALEKALAAAGVGGAEALVWTSMFAQPTNVLGSYLGALNGRREALIELAPGVRWVESMMGETQFFHLAGRVKAAQLAKAFEKVDQGHRKFALGQLSSVELEWDVDPATSEAAAKKAKKALDELPGVKRCVFDAKQHTLRLELVLEGIEGGRSGGSFVLRDTVKGILDQTQTHVPPRALFDTSRVFEILDREGVRAVEAAALK